MRPNNLWPPIAVVLLGALYLAAGPPEAHAGARPGRHYSSVFEEDVFARHYSYEDFTRSYAPPTYAYPPSAGCPPRYDYPGYYYRLRYYRIGTFHHYHPLPVYSRRPRRDISYRQRSLPPRFPFFPHRSYGRPGAFWWVPHARHRRIFWRIIRPVQQPNHPHREFFQRTD